MKHSAPLTALALGGVAILALTSCAANEGGAAQPGETGANSSASQYSGSLVGVGASSQGAAQEAWIAGFQTANPDATINYDPAGSGAGRETFQQGGSSFAGSDRAFKTSEIADGPFEACATDSGIIELPLYVSPIAVIFNLDGIDSLNLDAATIAHIFRGDITEWNDAKIAEQNPGVTLPAQRITPVHRSDESGTTENFVDYLSATAGDVWTDEVSGDWPTALGGEAAQGTSGVVDTVTNGVGTIGYADASRANGLGTVAVKVGEKYVSYSPEAAAAVVDASPLASATEDRGAGDLALVLDRTSTAEGTYPVVLVSYVIACETYADPANVDLVTGYLSYLASEEGQNVAAAAAGNAPISAETRTRVNAAIELIS